MLKFDESYYIVEVGGRTIDPEEQQRQVDQRAAGVNLERRGMETPTSFIQGFKYVLFLKLKWISPQM